MEEKRDIEKDKNTDEQILSRARERFAFGIEANSVNREMAIEDMEFRAGDQWPDEIKQKRTVDRRPCLTVNRIPQYVHQITNDQRQNNPAILVSPYDDNADPDTAKVIQGLIRNIENNSNADTAYDEAFDSAVSGGRGYFRIITDYCDFMSFNQDIKIVNIKDPHRVILDPRYKNPDGSDANWGFIFDDVARDEFKVQHPEAEVSRTAFEWADTQRYIHWFDKDNVRVAEYYEKHWEEEKLYQLPDGSTALESDIKRLSAEQKERLGLTDEIIENLEFRKTMVIKVYWYKMNGIEILEKTEWPSRFIPIIPVHGEELIVDGERIFEGIIRHAKDPQRMYNYWATCETEAIALAPKSPWILAEGQIEGHENQWDTAHLNSYAYLQYKPTTINGELAPPPQRQFAEPPVQAITQARMIASDDLKSTTGIYDAALGNRSNEQSGVAITRRAMQAQTGNFHFIDNLRRSIRHGGRIIVDLLPRIYDSKRVVRILGEDDEQQIVRINQMFTDEAGEQKIYDFSTGKYDVTVSSGPGYATKRQEAVDAMLQLSQHYPALTQVAGDLVLKNMDWNGAEEIAERIKKTIPAHITSDKKTPIPPIVKDQMDKMGQMVEQLTAQLNETQDKLDDKIIEIESKERIEMAKIQSNMQIKKAELDSKEAATPQELSGLINDIVQIKQRLSQIGFNEPINDDEIANALEQELTQANNNLPGESTPEMPGPEPME